jgi:hypothetical protein
LLAARDDNEPAGDFIVAVPPVRLITDNSGLPVALPMRGGFFNGGARSPSK